MIRKFTCILSIFIVLISCKNDDGGMNCAAVLCAESSPLVYLQLLDQSSQENLLDNEEINGEAIVVKDESGSEVEFTIQDWPVGKTILIPVSLEAYGSKSFMLTFENKAPFSINFETSYEGTSECCGTYITASEVSVTMYEFEYEDFGSLPISLSVFMN